jgi:hypothetical protein
VNESIERLYELYIFANYENRPNKLKYADFRPSVQLEERYKKSKRNFMLNYQSQPQKYKRSLYDENNDFEGCFKIGQQFERFVTDEFRKYGIPFEIYGKDKQFKGESNMRLEIKHDYGLNGDQEHNVRAYGNVYIEYDAISKDGTRLIEGGITKYDNVYFWLIGSEQEYYIFYKKDLYNIYAKMILQNEYINGCYKKKREKNNVVTSHGIAISRQKCQELMIADNIPEFIEKVSKDRLLRLIESEI